MNRNTYAVDFESYYDKRCSIKVLGPLGYFSHPDFDAYLVSVVGDDGFEFVGHPKDFDWSMLKDQIVLSHNASFDETLYLFGVDKGWWGGVECYEWHCTADMAAYCGHPRSLKNASKEVLGVDIDKGTRDNMRGKQWDLMDMVLKAEVLEYAMLDSEYCLQLWQALNGKWPEFERKISRFNRRCSQKGLPIDLDLLKKQKESISKQLFDLENSIPWIDHAPLLSRKAFNEECRKAGVVPPESLALTSTEANDWIKEHGKKYVWIEAVRNFRRVNSVKRKLESFEYASMSDKRFYGNIMYFGASVTGRFSGSGGNLNLQNLPRGDLFGCNLRNLIKAPKGKKLVVADLSQIEVRTLCWLAGAEDMLEDIRKSDDIYEAFAITFGEWSEDKGELKSQNPALRHKVKTMVLGCGYGVGYKKFASISGMSENEAKEAVNLYRNHMYRVVRLWKKYGNMLPVAFTCDTLFEIKLPSGRAIKYGLIKQDPKVDDEEKFDFTARVVKNAARRPVKLYGGLLAENASQALARDVFSDAMLRMDEEGLNVICHVHDEVIIECGEDEADEVLDKALNIMKTPPKWIPDLPLDAEGKVVKRYEK
jgi:DNA polymerase I-like protein with 3'-5' exonuclease and polymerase domains